MLATTLTVGNDLVGLLVLVLLVVVIIYFARRV